MTNFPVHTIDSAPEGSRQALQSLQAALGVAYLSCRKQRFLSCSAAMEDVSSRSRHQALSVPVNRETKSPAEINAAVAHRPNRFERVDAVTCRGHSTFTVHRPLQAHGVQAMTQLVTKVSAPEVAISSSARRPRFASSA
jgi:hypothetical protein